MLQYDFLGTLAPRNDGEVVYTVNFFAGKILKIGATQNYQREIKNHCWFRVRYLDSEPQFLPSAPVFYSRWYRYYPSIDTILYNPFESSLELLARRIEFVRFKSSLPLEPITYTVSIEVGIEW